MPLCFSFYVPKSRPYTSAAQVIWEVILGTPSGKLFLWFNRSLIPLGTQRVCVEIHLGIIPSQGMIDSYTPIPIVSLVES